MPKSDNNIRRTARKELQQSHNDSKSVPYCDTDLLSVLLHMDIWTYGKHCYTYFIDAFVID